MQQGNFINVFLARRVSGTYVHHQEHWMLSCSIWFSARVFGWVVVLRAAAWVVYTVRMVPCDGNISGSQMRAERRGLFRRARKILKFNYLLRHVCPSAWNDSAPTGWIVVNCDI